jgi:branched-chain amino acid aminotransferase
MWVDKIVVDRELFSSDAGKNLQPMGVLQLSPAATVLNYGQALFEGLKAFRREDGSIALFRPERNAWRMQQGAQRFLLPTVPTDVFVQAAEHVVRANSRWIPPLGKGALYLREYGRKIW